jgi:hypothetical protein
MYKPSGQEWLCAIECKEVLPAATALSTVAASAVNATLHTPAPEVLALPQPPILDTQARITVRNGTVGHTYRVLLTMLCNDSPQTQLTEHFTVTIV